MADFDGDGWQDIYFVNGRDLYNRGISVRNALYRNNGDGTFTDVTDKAGVPGNGYGLGCVWGDYDNDGFPDLYVTQYGTQRPLPQQRRWHVHRCHRQSGRRREAISAPSSTPALPSSTTIATANSTSTSAATSTSAPTASVICTMGGSAASSCRPAPTRAAPDVLYHNNGDGTFTNVTKAAKIYQPKGKNLSVGAADYDNDGWPDLFVANDG